MCVCMCIACVHPPTSLCSTRRFLRVCHVSDPKYDNGSFTPRVAVGWNNCSHEEYSRVAQCSPHHPHYDQCAGQVRSAEDERDQQFVFEDIFLSHEQYHPHRPGSPAQPMADVQGTVDEHGNAASHDTGSQGPVAWHQAYRIRSVSTDQCLQYERPDCRHGAPLQQPAFGSVLGR